MFLLKTRSGPKKKPEKRLKPIAKRNVFNAHSDNPFKSYQRRLADYQVIVRAQIARQDRLRNRSPAEMRFSEMLDAERILYESEAIFLNGDRFILADFYFKAKKLVIELDGSAHEWQKGCDAGRDAWLLPVYGVNTVLEFPAAQSQTQTAGFSSPGGITGFLER